VRVYRNKVNYSEYVSNCIPMSTISQAQSHSHAGDRTCKGERNQPDSILDEPAVAATVPIMAWCVEIFMAEGRMSCERPNNIRPPTMSNNGIRLLDSPSEIRLVLRTASSVPTKNSKSPYILCWIISGS
jgi:hypothetical protein